MTRMPFTIAERWIWSSWESSGVGIEGHDVVRVYLGTAEESRPAYGVAGRDS